MLNLLGGVWLVVVGACELLGLLLVFLGLALVHRLVVFWVWHSFLRAVPYFSSLMWHLLALAGWQWSSRFFAVQFMHLNS